MFKKKKSAVDKLILKTFPACNELDMYTFSFVKYKYTAPELTTMPVYYSPTKRIPVCIKQTETVPIYCYEHVSKKLFLSLCLMSSAVAYASPFKTSL